VLHERWRPLVRRNAGTRHYPSLPSLCSSCQSKRAVYDNEAPTAWGSIPAISRCPTTRIVPDCAEHLHYASSRASRTYAMSRTLVAPSRPSLTLNGNPVVLSCVYLGVRRCE
jgi:hypothetical protein